MDYSSGKSERIQFDLGSMEYEDVRFPYFLELPFCDLEI